MRAVPKVEHRKNCGKHTVKVVVTYTQGKPKRRSDLIAAQLRTIAVYTDGLCAEKEAEDDKIETSGLRLQFTSKEKWVDFDARVSQYVPKIVHDRLTIPKPPPVAPDASSRLATLLKKMQPTPPPSDPRPDRRALREERRTPDG